MANIYNFYGDSEDIRGIWKFLGEIPGMRFVETFSQKNHENRYFECFPEQLLSDPIASSIAAWPSAVGGRPRQRIYRLPEDSATKLRASGISVLESPAFLKITRAPSPNAEHISPREFRYWTEKTARQFGKVDFAETQNDEIDWTRFKKTTDMIISHIRKTSIARWNTKPVLPGCAGDLKANSRKLWFWGQEGTI